jgi:hypothetical protein
MASPEKTHPFGKAYQLNLEEMFGDLLADHRNPEEAGKQVIKAVTEEVKKFFDKTASAEVTMRMVCPLVIGILLLRSTGRLI